MKLFMSALVAMVPLRDKSKWFFSKGRTMILKISVFKLR